MSGIQIGSIFESLLASGIVIGHSHKLSHLVYEVSAIITWILQRRKFTCKSNGTVDQSPVSIFSSLGFQDALLLFICLLSHWLFLLSLHFSPAVLQDLLILERPREQSLIFFLPCTNFLNERLYRYDNDSQISISWPTSLSNFRLI